MRVTKSVSVDANDLISIGNEVKSGNYLNVSDFIQKAVKNELERKEELLSIQN